MRRLWRAWRLVAPEVDWLLVGFSAWCVATLAAFVVTIAADTPTPVVIWAFGTLGAVIVGCLCALAWEAYPVVRSGLRKCGDAWRQAGAERKPPERKPSGREYVHVCTREDLSAGMNDKPSENWYEPR